MTPTAITTSAYTDTPGLVGTGYYTVKAVDLSNNVSAGAALAVERDIAFRGSTTASNGSTAGITVARPSTAAAGDVLLATIDVLGAPTISTPTGWALVQTDASGTTLRQSTYVHVVASSEPSSYSWTFGSAQAATAVIAAYGGVDTVAPVDVHGGQANASSTSITAPSVTTMVPDTLLVVASGNANNGTITQASGLVEQGEIALSSGTRKVATETADQIRSTTGATGARVATTTKAAVSIGQAIALRPSTAPPPQAAVPTVPQNVSATAVVGSIKLAWSTPSSDGGAPITNYRIYRGTTSGGESLLTTVGNTTNYVDSAVTTGSSYFYRVAAVNSVGEGPQSAEVSAAPITVTVPGPPQNLTAAAAKPRGVGMSWSAPASNGGSTITGYRVYRSTASGQETLLTTVGVVTSYTDTLTTSGVRYYYKVLAFSSAGDGALSNEATAIAR